MRIDSYSWRERKRVCISVDDDLIDAFAKFSKKSSDRVREFLRNEIHNGDLKNSRDAKMYIFSQMMKPSAFKCFAGSIPDQVDLEDI